MTQLAMFEERVRTARAVGSEAAERCADKATRVSGFDLEGARVWVVAHLRKHGPTSGEDLTDGLKIAGFRPHSDKAFGAVYQTLVTRKQIEQYGYCPRRKGHGTAGGNIWRIVR